MSAKVFFSVSMSLDGFIAPESPHELMGQQWMELQQWAFPQKFFRENLKLGEGGEEGLDNNIAQETFERTGASVMGKRMFETGEHSWPGDAPFHTPVFVLTHEKRDPWERAGGTTYHFVNDGIESTLNQAREAAGDRDVRVAGGGESILEYLNAGSVDEFSIALSPVLFGSGIRLFEGVDDARVALTQLRSVDLKEEVANVFSSPSRSSARPTSSRRCPIQGCGYRYRGICAHGCAPSGSVVAEGDPVA
ncbi:MAG: dihydrofolate reductase family protein [Actinomycetota bacterium]|nr:dihydrofolate reductase family protein [Actinomycetota bacterium]